MPPAPPNAAAACAFGIEAAALRTPAPEAQHPGILDSKLSADLQSTGAGKGRDHVAEHEGRFVPRCREAVERVSHCPGLVMAAKYA
jgi:hypothetical protein